MQVSRLLFPSNKSKNQLMQQHGEGNKPKIESAPVVAIVARDTKFIDRIEKLAPHMNAEDFQLK